MPNTINKNNNNNNNEEDDEEEEEEEENKNKNYNLICSVSLFPASSGLNLNSSAITQPTAQSSTAGVYLLSPIRSSGLC
jgi:hypothetical protein